MRLAELKDELVRWPDLEAMTVATRVAALYDTCLNCEGTGTRVKVSWLPDEGVGRKCGACGGTGVIPKMGVCSPLKTTTLIDLAAYLFGDDT